jgi:hypothetical protein
MKASLASLCLALAACTGVGVSSDFETGSAGAWEQVGPDVIRVAVPGQADVDGRNRQASWYHFQVTDDRGVRGPLTFVMTNLVGEYDYRPGAIAITDDTPPLVSEDGVTWRHVEGVRMDTAAKELVVPVNARTRRFWVAHVEPYPHSRLEKLLGELKSPDLAVETIGKTVQGRDLRLVTITDRSVDDAGKKSIWLMGRQHAWETGTSFVVEGAIRWLLTDDAKEVRKRAVFHVFPMMDPDGVVAGGVRFNRNGYDVNRNWDTCDPSDAASRAKMPEIAAAKARLSKSKVDLFLTLHNQERGGWLSGSDEFKELAERFYRELQENTSCSLPDKGPRPQGPAPAPGRASVPAWVLLHLRRPGFILEQGVAKDAKLGRLPVSADRLRFGAELARTMEKILR